MYLTAIYVICSRKPMTANWLSNIKQSILVVYGAGWCRGHLLNGPASVVDPWVRKLCKKKQMKNT